MEQNPKLPDLSNRGPGPGPRQQPVGGVAPAGAVDDLAKWIKTQRKLADHGNQALVEKAESLAQTLVEAGLNTTQIRKILARINALSAHLQAQEKFDTDEVPLLKVPLVYAAAREKQKVGPLAAVLVPAIDCIHDKDDFRWFARFVEAVVAYHRFHGGRD